MSPVHRKRREAFDLPGHAHCLTYSCAARLPLLSSDRTCQWVVKSIVTARDRNEFDVYAYVIMPEHVHLLVRPRSATYKISKFLYDLKRPVSRKAKTQLMSEGHTVWVERLTVLRAGKPTFRFWLPGGGFDRNVVHQQALKNMAEYMHANPVRRGLVRSPLDWKWSSASFYAGKSDVPLRMDALPL